MDGRLMRCGIISSCQSAATSEIVKRSLACAQRVAVLYQVLDLYLYLWLLSILPTLLQCIYVVVHWFSIIWQLVSVLTASTHCRRRRCRQSWSRELLRGWLTACANRMLMCHRSYRYVIQSQACRRFKMYISFCTKFSTFTGQFCLKFCLSVYFYFNRLQHSTGKLAEAVKLSPSTLDRQITCRLLV